MNEEIEELQQGGRKRQRFGVRNGNSLVEGMKTEFGGRNEEKVGWKLEGVNRKRMKEAFSHLDYLHWFHIFLLFPKGHLNKNGTFCDIWHYTAI